MQKTLLSTILLTLISLVAQSQSNHCSFSGELSSNYYRYLQSNYDNDIEIEKIINKIVKEVGLEKNFIYVNSPGLNNCAALNYDGFRYILYDKSFLNSLSNLSSKKISVYISILAHEIGHHLQGHTLKNISEEDNKISELEADKFSGYIMAKLGYSLANAKEAINKTSNTYSNTHPLKNKRLLAIEEGFYSAKIQIQISKDQIKDNLYVEYFMKAQEDYNNGKYIEAIDNSTTAITLNKNNNFFPIALRAIAYSQVKSYDLALNDFKKLELIPMEDKNVISSYLYYNRGFTLYKMDNYDKASKDFYRAYELNNNDKIALINFAKNQSLAGNHSSALKTFEVQLKDEDILNSELQNFTKGDIFLQKAISYDETNNYDEALKYFDIAQDLYPEEYINLSHPLYYKGKLYQKTENVDKSISSYLSFLKIYNKEQEYFFIDHNFALANDVYYNLGLLYQQKQEYKLSIEYLGKLINNGPEFDLGYFFRGMSYYLMGENSKAEIDIKKSCDLGNTKACGFLKNLISNENEEVKNPLIIEGGYKTQKILEYQYNNITKSYDLVFEQNIPSELYFTANGLAFKRGGNKWLFSDWTYKGVDNNNNHVFFDFYNQSILFDKNLKTISWYAEYENNNFQKVYVYQFLTKDNSVFPITQNSDLFYDSPSLELVKVEATDTQTIITLKHKASNIYENGGWISISSDSYLISHNSKKKYKLVETKEIPFSPKKYYYKSQNEVHQFQLIFEPIKEKNSIVNMIECEGITTCFNIYNIEVVKK